MDWLYAAWLVLAAVITFNLSAAGAAALLYGWRSRLRRGSRTFLASAVTGFLPASSFMAIGLYDSGDRLNQDAAVYASIFVMSFAIAAIVSLPGAIIVSRKLEAPGDDFRAFE